jgi:hypothetical protein
MYVVSVVAAGPPLHHNKGKLRAPSALEGAPAVGDGGWCCCAVCASAGVVRTPWAAELFGGFDVCLVDGAGLCQVVCQQAVARR